MAILVQSNKKPSVSYPEQTGAIITFNSQYAGLPLKSHKVAVTATQSGSGTPSPDNIRSINGWSNINIGAVGANVWDETTKNGYYHTVGGYYVNVAGQLCSKTPIDVLPNTTYRFCKPNTQGDVLFYDENGTYLNQYVVSVRKNGTFTTPSGCYKININLGNNYGATYNNDVLIAYPSGTYTTINLGGTYYLAEYDARTGLFKVLGEAVEMSTITYNVGFGGYYTGYYANTIKVPDTAANSELMCSCFAVGNTIGDDNIFIQPTGSSYSGYIIILPSATYQDTNAFRNSLQGQYLVYPFKNPTTIQLPPCPIDTLEVNNIWADTGETTLQYPKFG